MTVLRETVKGAAALQFHDALIVGGTSRRIRWSGGFALVSADVCESGYANDAEDDVTASERAEGHLLPATKPQRQRHTAADGVGAAAGAESFFRSLLRPDLTWSHDSVTDHRRRAREGS